MISTNPAGGITPITPNGPITPIQPAAPVDPVQAGFRAGVTLKINNWDDVDAVEACSYGFCRAVQTTIDWAEINPAPGVFDFSEIDRRIGILSERGRAIVLAVTFANGKVAGEPNTATPAWHFEGHSEYFGGFHTENGYVSKYPVWWGVKYATHRNALITALAKKYDGHPWVSYIRATGYGVGSAEPNLYANVGLEFINQLIEAGIEFSATRVPKPIMGYSDNPYGNAIDATLDFWLGKLYRTPIQVTFRVPGTGTQKGLNEGMLAKIREHKLLCGNTNLSVPNNPDQDAEQKAIRELGASLTKDSGCTFIRADTDDAGEAGGITESYVEKLGWQATGHVDDPAPKSYARVMVVGMTIARRGRDVLAAIGERLIDPNGF